MVISPIINILSCLRRKRPLRLTVGLPFDSFGGLITSPRFALGTSRAMRYLPNSGCPAIALEWLVGGFWMSRLKLFEPNRRRVGRPASMRRGDRPLRAHAPQQ